MNKTPVVILGLQDTGLYAAQSAGRFGIPVYGFDFNTGNPGFYSRYIKASPCPHPYYESEKLLDQLLGNTSGKLFGSILIASTESYLAFCSGHREELAKRYRFVIPEKKILGSVLDKTGQFKLARDLGFPVPDHSRIINRKDIEDSLSKYVHKNVIVKGLDQAAWKAKINRKAFIPRNQDELVEICDSLTGKEIPFIIQEIIDGDCTNNFEYNALMIKGEIVESSVIQKIRQYPPGFGAACCIRTSDNSEIEKLGRKFVVQNRIEGFSNTEFKFNPSDGKYYFIETNARIWSQIRLSEYNGQNFMVQYYNKLAESPVIYLPVRKNKQIKWIDFFADSVLWWRVLRRKNMSFFSWLHSFSGVKNFGLLNLKDIRPFLHEITEMNLFKPRKRTN